MEAPPCSGCRARDARLAEQEARIAALEEEVRQLKALLGRNASNSSTPPSANPLGAPSRLSRKSPSANPADKRAIPRISSGSCPPNGSGKSSPSCPGSASAVTPRCPAKPVRTIPSRHAFKSSSCPNSWRRLPSVKDTLPHCPGCGEVTRAVIGQELRDHSVGPRLTSRPVVFDGLPRGEQTGRRRDRGSSVRRACPLRWARSPTWSKRSAPRWPSPTPKRWRRCGRRPSSTPTRQVGNSEARCGGCGPPPRSVAVFAIHARRNAAGLTAALGEHIHGILCSDRWGVYNRVSAACRQLCWAHLKRDFQKVVDRGGPSQGLGRAGPGIVKKVFGRVAGVPGRASRGPNSEAQLDPIAWRLNRVLLEGALLGEGRPWRRFARTCWRWSLRCGRSRTSRAWSRPTISWSGYCAEPCCGYAAASDRGAKRAAISWSAS